MQVTLQMADMSEESRGNKHRVVMPCQIEKSENDIRKVLEAFETFLNPFKLEGDEKLYRIASGAAAPLEIELDVIKAESVGRSAKGVIYRRSFEKK